MCVKIYSIIFFYINTVQKTYFIISSFLLWQKWSGGRHWTVFPKEHMSVKHTPLDRHNTIDQSCVFYPKATGSRGMRCLRQSNARPRADDSCRLNFAVYVFKELQPNKMSGISNYVFMIFMTYISGISPLVISTASYERPTDAILVYFIR